MRAGPIFLTFVHPNQYCNFNGQEEGFLIKNFIGPLLGLALVSISGTTATAQQKSTEPATVTSAMGAIL